MAKVGVIESHPSPEDEDVDYSQILMVLVARYTV